MTSIDPVSFPYLMQMAVQGRLDEAGEVLGRFFDSAPPEKKAEVGIWRDFLRRRMHILRRGDVSWPAWKILLQLALEHADESPVTMGAEAWVEATDYFDPMILLCDRPKKVLPDPCQIVFEGHTEMVRGGRPVTDGRLLSWSSDKTMRLWDLATGVCLRVFEGHGNSVNGVAALPDGRFASWSSDGIISLWDLSTTECTKKLEGHTESILGLKVLADGRLLSWSEDGTFRLWNVPLDGSFMEFLGHTCPVSEVEPLPDGRFASWSKEEKTVRTWNGSTGVCEAEFPTKVDRAWFLPGGRLVSSFSEGGLRIWNLSTCECTAVLDEKVDDVLDVEVLPDDRLATASSDGPVRIWRCSTGECERELKGHDVGICQVEHLRTGLLMGRAWNSCCINEYLLWKPSSGVLVARFTVAQGGGIGGIHVLPDGRLLTRTWDEGLAIWSGSTGDCLATFVDRESDVNGADLLPDGRILSWSLDGTLRLWEASRGSRKPIDSEAPLVKGFCLSSAERRHMKDSTPKGERRVVQLSQYEHRVGKILSWGGDGELRVWDVATGECVAVLRGHEDCVCEAKYLPDGRIVSWSYDETIRLWDESTEACIGVFVGHRDVWTISANVIELLPDGRLVSLTRWALRIWDVQTCRCQAVCEGFEFKDLALVGDDRLAAWNWWNESYSGSIFLLDMMTGALVSQLKGHTGGVKGVHRLPGGRFQSWSADGIRRTWDSTNGEFLGMEPDVWQDASAKTHLGMNENGYICRFADGRILTNSDDRKSLRLTNSSDECLAVHHEDSRKSFVTADAVSKRAVIQIGDRFRWLRLPPCEGEEVEATP